MTSIRCFNPIADERSRALILGSMPGPESLKVGQYYAYSRNAFWPIMGELFGAGPDKPYDERIAVLKSASVALWDSLKTCVRPDASDASITEGEVNDFPEFLAMHPKITHIFFNGAKSEQTFKRNALPSLSRHGLVFTRLPSTSPAHAAMPLSKKVEAWSALMEALKQG